MDKLLLLTIGIGIGAYYSDYIKNTVGDVTNEGAENG